MKTKLSDVRTLLFTGFIYGVGIVIQHQCFSDDKQPTADSPFIYKEPTSDFKQLTNQEMYKLYLESTRPEYREFGNKERFMKSHQSTHDYFLENLLLGQVKPDSEHREQLDKNSFKKLAWVIETDKTTYRIGERINIRILLQNISEDEITVFYPLLERHFLLQSMSLRCDETDKAKKTSVYLTQGAYQEYRRGIISVSSGPTSSYLLKPGDTAPTFHTIKCLNPFYDLSMPSEYELTFYTRNFLCGDENQIGEYPKSCTVHFTIEAVYGD